MMRFIDQLAAIGFDALDPMEAPPFGDADLAAAGEIIAGRYCMVGNLDDMELLGKLSAEEIKAIARERAVAAGDAPFILGGTASGTYNEAAARNFIAMVEVAEELA